jgi:hypothetical protein
LDVTADAEARTATVPLLPDATGDATVAGHTVVFEDGVPSRTVAIVDVAGGRTIARCADVEVAAAFTADDWVGRPVQVTEPGVFFPPSIA